LDTRLPSRSQKHAHSHHPGRDRDLLQGLGQRAADDLAAVLEALDLTNVVLVGHSTGGGEVTRYVGRHGTSRVAKMVLLGAIPPLMLKTDANPEGLPIEAFDQIRVGILRDRSQFYRDLVYPFYGANQTGPMFRKAPGTRSG
jgi:pimeloyl-ACP methyl ester carboxylesterase